MPLAATGTPNSCVLSSAVGTATVTRTFPLSCVTACSKNVTSLRGFGRNEPQPADSVATRNIVIDNSCLGLNRTQEPSLDRAPIGTHLTRTTRTLTSFLCLIVATPEEIDG